MQTNPQSPSEKEPVEVMVRSYGDEPVRLRAIARDFQRVTVCGANSQHALRYPADLVFDYDEDRFRAILRAFEGEDEGSLKRLWDAGESWINR